MKIASGLISILFSVLVFFQSFVLSVGGSFFNDESAASGGAVGILVALLFFIGGAFAFKLPKVAMIISVVTAFFAFMNYIGGDFPDMGVWAVLALCLAVMEFFAGRKKKIKEQDTTTAPPTL